ncbi:LOW QUALITY PROTEIN: kelch-like protein 35 [Rhynchonycteris naso]
MGAVQELWNAPNPPPLDRRLCVLQRLSAYWRSGTLTDVGLSTGGRDFPCHRTALCAGSTCFCSLSTAGWPERGLAVVPVEPKTPHGATGAAAALAVVLNNVRGEEVRLREDAAAVLELAERLDVAGLREISALFLGGRLRFVNSLALRRVAAAFLLPSLTEGCGRALRRAYTVVSHASFLELAPDEVAAQCDPALVGARGEAVFERAMHHVAPAHGQLRRLLQHVRLPLLAPDYLEVEADELLWVCGECGSRLLEARACFILGRETAGLRTRPRRFMDLAEVIVVIGGCDCKGFLKLPFINAYHSESQRWTLPSLPGYVCSDFTACTLCNDIYISGGHINSHEWIFSSHLHTWIKVASLHKMAVLWGQLLVVHGFDGLQRLQSVEQYDPFSNTWAAVVLLPEAVSSAAVVLHWPLYVTRGGGTGQEGISTDKVQCFDPKEDPWSLQSPAPFSQRCLVAVSLEDTIYSGGLMSKVFIYNPSKDVWGEAAVLPSPVESCGMTCDGKVHILGGRDDHRESTNRVFTFDPSSGQMEAQPSLQCCTSSHSCVTTVHLGRNKTSFKVWVCVPAQAYFA